LAATKSLYVVIVILLAAMLVSATLAAFYLFQYDRAHGEANTYLSELKSAQPTQVTNILLDFGNGTRLWHNDTQVQTGANAYVATVIVAHGVVNATWYPQYGEHLVTGVDNVQNTQQESWFLWTYNNTSHWEVAQTGADLLSAYNGSVFGWTYCAYNSATYVPSCTP
jgi:hypothetical protein